MALAFNRYPLHELGCDSVWGSFPRLVDRGTSFVSLAVRRNFVIDRLAVHSRRELGKEKNEVEPAAK